MKENTGFTLLELIVVIVIIGVLATLGVTQYSLVVENGRTAEARARIGLMLKRSYEYFMKNGTLDTLASSDVGENNTCDSSNFYRYSAWGQVPGVYATMLAYRCTSGGKSPNTARTYQFYVNYYWASDGRVVWRCRYDDDLSPCFGLPP